MHLTTFTDYALRTLIFCACKADERCQLDDIAQSFAISRHHISKVVHKLGELGYLETTRGKNGGLRLAIPAEDINIADVVKACEPHLNILECFDNKTSSCPLTDRCALQIVLQQARDAFFRELSFCNLADIVRVSKKPMLNLLHKPAN